MFMISIKCIIDNSVNLFSSNISADLYSLIEYLFNPYLLFSYIILVLYSLVRRNSRILLILNNIPLYILLNLYIYNINYLNLSPINSINGSILSLERLYLCIILFVVALNNLLCGLVNYMIFGTGLSDLNCNYFDNYNYNYIKTLLQLTIFSFGLAFGISS